MKRVVRGISVLPVLQHAMFVQRATTTTLFVLVAMRVMLERTATQRHNRQRPRPATIVPLDDIPKQKVWARKTCVCNATPENIPTKLAIKIHCNAKNVALDSFQMNLVLTNVQIVPRWKPLKLVQRFAPSAMPVNSCLPIKSVHRAL